MKIIGVTGGMGSGKSTVSQILNDLGASVINADSIAREVVSKGGKPLEEIVEYFGMGILDKNGELDRRKLGNIVFNNPEKLNTLNIITHKHIAEKIHEKVESLKNESNTSVVAIDAPIPIEYGFLDLCDTVWVVVADAKVRIKRVMERDNLSYDEALSRLKAQKRDEEYLKMADEVLVNNGNIEELEKEVVRLYFKNEKVQEDSIG